MREKLYWAERFGGGTPLNREYGPDLQAFFVDYLQIPAKERVSSALARLSCTSSAESRRGGQNNPTSGDASAAEQLYFSSMFDGAGHGSLGEENYASSSKIHIQHQRDETLIAFLKEVNDDENFEDYCKTAILPVVADWHLRRPDDASLLICDVSGWDLDAVQEVFGEEYVLVALSPEEVALLPKLLQRCGKLSDLLTEQEDEQLPGSSFLGNSTNSNLQEERERSCNMSCIFKAPVPAMNLPIDGRRAAVYLARAAVMRNLQNDGENEVQYVEQQLSGSTAPSEDENLVKLSFSITNSARGAPSPMDVTSDFHTAAVVFGFGAGCAPIPRHCDEIHIYDTERLNDFPTLAATSHLQLSFEDSTSLRSHSKRSASTSAASSEYTSISPFCAYSPSDKILFLGEGQHLSFAAALCRA
ncbi:unnamed protein product, partial [Amoebophrya sp. A25]|eukprot:GSA25T00012818001.1